jgi:arsenate reductase
MSSTVLTIYHNPACSTSRKVLGMLRDSGAEVEVVDYLKTGWTRPLLERLLQAMHAAPRDILRAREPLAREMGLAEPGVAGDAILDAMIAHPVLVERPIVVGAKGTVLARPAEAVEALL